MRTVIRMRILTVKVPEGYLAAIDELVRKGRYANRSDFVRKAIELLLAIEYNRLQEEGARGGE